MEDVLLKQYSDADLASDIRTHRSTSASFQAIWGPYTRAGQSMGSQRPAFPTVHLRQRLSLPTVLCEKSCLQHYRFGKYCLTD
eukprot:7189180-Pyramimonas_sp.AAC.1